MYSVGYFKTKKNFIETLFTLHMFLAFSIQQIFVIHQLTNTVPKYIDTFGF